MKIELSEENIGIIYRSLYREINEHERLLRKRNGKSKVLSNILDELYDTVKAIRKGVNENK